MTYSIGDELVALAIEDDKLRVSRSVVLDAGQPRQGNTQWIRTMHGETVVDRDGVSFNHPAQEVYVIPMDKDLAKEFVERGDTFTVIESLSDLEVSREDRLRNTVEFELPSLEQDLDGGSRSGWER
jgi:hypothetical protein